MYIARILYPVKVLGPGNRVAIWFNGCIHKCSGCSNPELWELQDRYKTDLNTIMRMIESIQNTYSIDGFTLTGGDPFYQPNTLRELLPKLRNISSDILCYTGYKFEDIKYKYSDIICYISVLIDGKYEEQRNYGEMLRGSDNQNIIILNPEYEEMYKTYCKQEHSLIQNFFIAGGVISVGIHRPGYEAELDLKLKEKGVKNINE